MNIIDRRNELNLSQKELAEACGITPQFLCDLEKGRSKPSINTAFKLAEVLKCDVKDLFE